LYVWGSSLADFIQDIDTSNTVDGKPVYYWVNQHDMTVPSDAGYAGLVNCTGITVENLNLTEGRSTIFLAYTANSTVTNNNITSSWYGIHIVSSSTNIVSGNNLANNTYGGVLIMGSSYNTFFGNTITNNAYGVLLSNSSDNLFYHNNFIDNPTQIAEFFLSNSTNIWDDGYPSGGNFWSDYSDVDIYSGPDQDEPGSDGIWDNPYIINTENQDNYPLIEPWIQSSPQNNYLVVRGSNDYIYLRKYNFADGLWDDWVALPGSTVDTPAAAILEDELHVVVRGMDGSTLWHGSYNLTSETFSGWSALAGSSPSPPVLTSNGTMLCLVVHGMDDLIYYKCYSEGSWGGWQIVPKGTTIDSPAAALLGNELHVFVRGFDGSTMWHTIIIPEGGVVKGWSWIPGATSSPPILAASQSRGELYLIVRGADEGIYYCQYDGSIWQDWTNLQGLTTRSPSATVCGNQLHVVVCGYDEITMWHGKVDLETDSFGGWDWISGSTPSAPTLTS